jgi:hypothetical protein
MSYSQNEVKRLIEETEKIHGSVGRYEIQIDPNKVKGNWNVFKPFSLEVPFIKADGVEGFLVFDANDNYLEASLISRDKMLKEPVFLGDHTPIADKRLDDEANHERLMEESRKNKEGDEKRKEKRNLHLKEKMEEVNGFLGTVYGINEEMEKISNGSPGTSGFRVWRIPMEYVRLVKPIRNIELIDGHLGRIKDIQAKPGESTNESVERLSAELNKQEMTAKYGFTLESKRLSDDRLSISLVSESGNRLARALIESRSETIDVGLDNHAEVEFFDESEINSYEFGKEVEWQNFVLKGFIESHIKTHGYLTECSTLGASEISDQGPLQFDDNEALSSDGLQLMLLGDAEEAIRIKSWILAKGPAAGLKKPVISYDLEI